MQRLSVPGRGSETSRCRRQVYILFLLDITAKSLTSGRFQSHHPHWKLSNDTFTCSSSFCISLINHFSSPIMCFSSLNFILTLPMLPCHFEFWFSTLHTEKYYFMWVLPSRGYSTYSSVRVSPGLCFSKAWGYTYPYMVINSKCCKRWLQIWPKIFWCHSGGPLIHSVNIYAVPTVPPKLRAYWCLQ